MTLQIKIKYRTPETKRLLKIDQGNWIDLYADERVVLFKGEHTLIHLGIVMKLPDNYEAYIAPRSSMYKSFKIIQANHFGIVDSSYCGDEDWWKLSVIAMEDTVIEKGSKLCQFRIQEKQPEFEFIEVDKLDERSRGGFGSTGTT